MCMCEVSPVRGGSGIGGFVARSFRVGGSFYLVVVIARISCTRGHGFSLSPVVFPDAPATPPAGKPLRAGRILDLVTLAFASST